VTSSKEMTLICVCCILSVLLLCSVVMNVCQKVEIRAHEKVLQELGRKIHESAVTP